MSDRLKNGSLSGILPPIAPQIFPCMAKTHPNTDPEVFHERSLVSFRTLFGDLLSQSSAVDTAILHIRLAAVDLSEQELKGVRSFRVLVAEVNSQTVEGEAYALAMDPLKRENLSRVLEMLRSGIMEIRSAPLGGWSPDFTVFSAAGNPHTLLLGVHWFHRPFPHRGPAWAARFGAEGARRGSARFEEIWSSAHDIGSAVQRLMERTTDRASFQPRFLPLGTPGLVGLRAVDTPKGPG